MARLLFVVPPLTGHVNPSASLGAALRARGHEVAWVGHPGAVRPLLPEGARLFPLDEREVMARRDRSLGGLSPARGLLAFKELWEELFLPLGRSMLPGVEAAARELRPDLLLVDQQALAGALAARRLGIRWATLATTAAGVVDSLADLPKVREWMVARKAELEREAGLAPRPEAELSPELVLVFSTPELAGPGPYPPQLRWIGPCFSPRATEPPFPWERLREGRLLFVSLGTVNAGHGGPLYRALVEALAEEPLQVVVAAPPEAFGPAPDNFLVVPRVPQLALLPRVSAVLCHGGQNTVCESLAHGLPLLVAPIRDDQPVIAQQIASAGAGLRLRFGRTSPVELRDAVRRVLGEPSFRAAADRIRSSFEAAGGTPAAVRALEALL